MVRQFFFALQRDMRALTETPALSHSSACAKLTGWRSLCPTANARGRRKAAENVCD
jgi:hypothetical protein